MTPARDVLDLVARETRRASRAARIAGLALPVGAAGAVLTCGALWLSRGRWMAMPRVLPFVVWALGALLLVLLVRRVRARLAHRSSSASVARAIEDEQRLRRGSLTGLVEVAGVGGAFVRKASAALGDKLAVVSHEPAPRHHRRLRGAALLSVIALAQVLTLATTSWATRADGWRALLNPVDAWRGTLLPRLELTDLPSRLARGAPASVAVLAEGRPTVTVHWRATGGAWRDTLLMVDSTGRAALTLGAVDADLALVADDGRTPSDTARVSVVDRPFVGDVTIRATYPAYLGRDAERLAADEPLRVPAGTRLDIAGHSSEPLQAVSLKADALGTTVELAAEGTSFRGTLRPSRTDTWAWDARGARQGIADLPAALFIEVVADSVPRVEILAPTGELLVGTGDRVTLDILAQDDHALTGVWLRRWIVDAQGRARDTVEQRLSEAREPEWVGLAREDLEPLGLVPGTSVHLVAFARDAAPGGAREGASRALVLRVPTTAEERKAARDVAEAAVAAANAAAAAQKQLAEQTASAARARPDRTTPADGSKSDAPQDKQAMDFENAQQARDIAERQRELQERVSGLEEAARDMEDHLRRAGALDTALARQLQDAQKLLREAMTPEMLEAMSQLENSAQQLDGARTRQSLNDLAKQQQQLREALEKSAEMLRRAALEGAMQTLGDEARDLAQRQQEFADSAAKSLPDQQDANRLERATSELAKSMEALQQRLEEERAKTGANEAGRAADAASRSEEALRQARERAAEAQEMGDSTATGKPPEQMTDAQREAAQRAASQAASQAAQAMQQSADAMSQARDQQVSEWKGELTDALDRSVQEMLQLAREQDALAEQARRDPSDPSTRAQQSALQQGVQTAQRRLQEEGKKSALVSPRTQQMMQQAQQRVTQATRQAAQGQPGQTSQSMQEAADALREAAAQLTRDRERASNSESASGLPELMEQLQQLAQQQGALNSQMQSLFPQPEQGRPSQLDEAGREKARELARAQREVARQLDEVSDADPTGRAQEMAREARSLAQALDRGAADPATLARQQRLFRRMLDAGQSLEQEQQDESQRRESRAARGTERFTPPDGPARGRAAVRYTVPTWEELRGLSADERRLVIEYFRRLNAEAKP